MSEQENHKSRRLGNEATEFFFEKLIKANSGVCERTKDYLLLQFIDLKEERMQPVVTFLEKIYTNMSAANFFGITDENEDVNKTILVVDRNRPIPHKRPNIEVLIADWDGTVGDYYEGIAYAVGSLLEYIANTRGLLRDDLEEKLIALGKNKVADCFLGPAYFSVGGARKILNSKELSDLCKSGLNKTFLSKLDEGFLNQTFKNLMIEAYAHVYEDTKMLFNTVYAWGVPIYIHSDSPLPEMIDKLKYSGMAKFEYDKEGNITAVKDCIFSGISAKKAGKGDVLNAEEVYLIKVFKEAGIDLILNSQEECKPSPAPLAKIQSSLENKGYGKIPADKMLMVGDFMAKDGMFAKNTGMYYAWPADRAIKSDEAVRVNKVTAAADVGYRNNISKQLEVLTNDMLKNDEKEMEAFAAMTAICADYVKLLDFFSFVSPKREEREKIITDSALVIQTISNTLNSENSFENIR